MFRSAAAVMLCPLARSARCLRTVLPMHTTRSRPGLTAVSCHTVRCLSTSEQYAQWSSQSAKSANLENSPSDPKTHTHPIVRDMLKLPLAEKEAYASTAMEKLTPEEEKRLRVLQLEYDLWMSTGTRVPEEMTKAMWLQLLHTASTKRRSSLYNYWFKTEMKKKANVIKKEKKFEAHLERKKEMRQRLEEEGKELGLPEGEIPIKRQLNFFLRSKTMLKHYLSNMAWAMQFGQPLVVDLSFEDNMTGRELPSLLRQLRDSYGVNKVLREPFNLSFTGIKPDGFLDHKLHYAVSENAPMTVTSDDYLSQFPRERLVYLTPDSPNELHTWDHNDIYIVGGIVILGCEKPLSFAKARQQKIRTAKLPLDHYLKFKSRGKSLSIDVMIKILCEMREHGDWNKALQHVPSRAAEPWQQSQRKPSWKRRH